MPREKGEWGAVQFFFATNGYPTFSTMTDLIMTTSMLPDVVDHGFKMAATKPELEITFEQ